VYHLTRLLSSLNIRWAATQAFTAAFVCTFFGFLDIPVFWPILLIYFLILFSVTMRKQIRHMIKYKYIPFSMGKKVYPGKMDSKK